MAFESGQWDLLDRIAHTIKGNALAAGDEDTANSFYQGMKGKFMSLYVQFASASSFDMVEPSPSSRSIATSALP